MMPPSQIRNQDVVRDIRRLAELKQQPITDVVAEAVRAQLNEAQRAREARTLERMRGIQEIQAHIAALPIIGPLLTDADLYDEDGLPK